MQKLISALSFILLLICPVVAKAAYIIKLKNGNEFVTGRYWYEGRQVMFDTYGGVFGVDRAFVTKIEQTNKPVSLTAAAQEVLEQNPQAETVKRKMEPAKATTSSESKAEDAKRNDDDPILKEFYALKEKSKGLDGMLTSELQEFDKELTRFKKRVRESRRLDAYMKELAEADELGDAMEAILKSRR